MKLERSPVPSSRCLGGCGFCPALKDKLWMIEVLSILHLPMKTEAPRDRGVRLALAILKTRQGIRVRNL